MLLIAEYLLWCLIMQYMRYIVDESVFSLRVICTALSQSNNYCDTNLYHWLITVFFYWSISCFMASACLASFIIKKNAFCLKKKKSFLTQKKKENVFGYVNSCVYHLLKAIDGLVLLYQLLLILNFFFLWYSLIDIVLVELSWHRYSKHDIITN